MRRFLLLLLFSTALHAQANIKITHEELCNGATIDLRQYGQFVEYLCDLVPGMWAEQLDDTDFDSHAYVFGLYYYGELVSTIRIHHVTPEHRVSQSAGAFPEAIDALLDAGLSLIDPARFAADPELTADLTWIPYLTLRPSIVAAAHFRAHRVLQFVRPPHAAFYKRVFYADTVVPGQRAKNYGIDMTLMATNVIEVGRKLLTRYPFFISSASEQRMMFARGPENTLPSLTIVPTARFVPEGQLGTDLPL